MFDVVQLSLIDKLLQLLLARDQVAHRVVQLLVGWVLVCSEIGRVNGGPARNQFGNIWENLEHHL